MENEITPCHICGAPAVHLLASGLLLCANVACYHASMELIKETLEKAQGGA